MVHRTLASQAPASADWMSAHVLCGHAMTAQRCVDREWWGHSHRCNHQWWVIKNSQMNCHLNDELCMRFPQLIKQQRCAITPVFTLQRPENDENEMMKQEITAGYVWTSVAVLRYAGKRVWVSPFWLNEALFLSCQRKVESQTNIWKSTKTRCPCCNTDNQCLDFLGHRNILPQNSPLTCHGKRHVILLCCMHRSVVSRRRR